MKIKLFHWFGAGDGILGMLVSALPPGAPPLQLSCTIRLLASLADNGPGLLVFSHRARTTVGVVSVKFENFSVVLAGRGGGG